MAAGVYRTAPAWAAWLVALGRPLGSHMMVAQQPRQPPE